MSTAAPKVPSRDEPGGGAAHGESAATRNNRAEKSAARRTAIVAAALEEFCTRGFAAARLDDVAKRAGVAKGTIYLHFRDKEALFQEIIRTMLVPMIAAMEAPSDLVRGEIFTEFTEPPFDRDELIVATEGLSESAHDIPKEAAE